MMKKFSRLICLILAVSVTLSICAVAFAANDIAVECEEEVVTAPREDGDSTNTAVALPGPPGTPNGDITVPPWIWWIWDNWRYN